MGRLARTFEAQKELPLLPPAFLSQIEAQFISAFGFLSQKHAAGRSGGAGAGGGTAVQSLSVGQVMQRPEGAAAATSCSPQPDDREDEVIAVQD